LLSQAVWVLSQSGARRTVEVEEAKPHGAFVLARLKGVADRGQAESLRGADVTVGRDRLPEPEVGEYYWSDLIGLAVRNMQGVELGTVTGLIAAPAHDVLRVAASATAKANAEPEGEPDPARERLIPFVEPILRVVDVEGGWITVDWEADY
jgi:16S rRNA processing protein RimM